MLIGWLTIFHLKQLLFNVRQVNLLLLRSVGCADRSEGRLFSKLVVSSDRTFIVYKAVLLALQSLFGPCS